MNENVPKLDELAKMDGDDILSAEDRERIDKLKGKVDAIAENTANAGFTEEAINEAAREILPTLDEASTELAIKLGKRHEERLAMRRRLLEGTTPRGRFRRNAPCPCGSGKKFKKCHMRDFKDKMKGRRSPQPIVTPDKDTTTDED